VNPIEHKIRRDQIANRLEPERQSTERSVSVLEEVDDGLLAVDVKNQRGAEHQQADSQEAGENRHNEPVGQIGNDVAAAPPGLAGIAGKADGEQREQDARGDDIGRELDDCLAERP
jgi:hypothetical protein